MINRLSIAPRFAARGHCVGALVLALALALPAHADGSKNWVVLREGTACYAAFLGGRNVIADKSTVTIRFAADTHNVAVVPIFGPREMTAAELAQHAVVLSGAAYQRFVGSASVLVVEVGAAGSRFERKVDTMGLNATLAMAATCAGTTASTPPSPPASPATPAQPTPPRPTAPTTPAGTVTPAPSQPATPVVPGTPVTPAAPASPAAKPVGTQCSATLVARLKALPLTDAVIAQVCQ